MQVFVGFELGAEPWLIITAIVQNAIKAETLPELISNVDPARLHDAARSS
jgi:hypothetical protein